LQATIKIAIIFIFLVILIGRKMAVEWALLLGTVVLGFLFLVPPIDFLREFMIGWLNADCLSLASTVYFITVLGEFMNRTGRMDRMMKALEDLMRDSRYVSAISTAIIGLLPMPGGALLSAPMVEVSGNSIGIPRDRMAAINFWFRHVWEYIWPFYPGVLLLTSKPLALNLSTIALAQFPLSIAAIVGGLVFLIWTIRKPPMNSTKQPVRANFKDIFLNLWPILVIILILIIPFPDAESLGLERRLLARFKLLGSLVISTVIFGYINRINRRTTKDVVVICLKKHTIMVVVAIMIFSHLIDYTSAAKDMAPFFKEIGFPPLALIFIMNFIVGMLTGITQAYVGICFPIIAPFMIHNGNVNLAVMQFAYMSGFIGVMLTPVHLCFTLTKEYFSVDWKRIYRLLIGPVIVMVIVSLVLAFTGLPWMRFFSSR